MGYRKEREAQLRTKKKIKYILLAAVTAVIAAVCIFSAFVPAASWKYYFSLPKIERRAEGEARVHFLDARNGDCTLVELPDGKNVLIGGGADDGAARKNVLRFLNALKIKRIDALIVPDATYRGVGALEEIIRYYEVAAVYLPEVKGAGSRYGSFSAELQRRGIPSYETPLGVLLSSEAYRLTVIYPLDDTQATTDTLLSLSCDGANVLLGGNYADDAIETLLTQKALGYGEEWGVELTDYDVAFLPVKTDVGLTEKLLTGFSVKQVVLSCQSGASYTPPQTLLDTLQQYGAGVYRTDEDGHITLTVKDGAYAFSTQR